MYRKVTTTKQPFTKKIAIFNVSDLLERKSTEAERQQGFEVADYLIRYDYRKFIASGTTVNKVPIGLQALVEVNTFKLTKTPIKPQCKQEKPDNWDMDIYELEKYFEGVKLPTLPIKLNPFSKIEDVSFFIESNFATIKANNCNRFYLPYLKGLQQLKQLLSTNLN